MGKCTHWANFKEIARLGTFWSTFSVNFKKNNKMKRCYPFQFKRFPSIFSKIRESSLSENDNSYIVPLSVIVH